MNARRNGFFVNRKAIVSKDGAINRPATYMSREIAWRQAHRFVTASSWLFRRWQAKGKARRKMRVNNNYKGSAAIIATAHDGPMYVELQNSQMGAIAQNERHGIIGKAIAQVTGDMLVYLKRKHEQRAAQFNRANPIFR